jgi:cell division protein ZipA
MEQLRWILLAVGVAIVVAVYLWGRAKKRGINYPTYVENDNVAAFSATDEEDGWCDGVGPVRVVQRFNDDEIDAFNIDESVSTDAVSDVYNKSALSEVTLAEGTDAEIESKIESKITPAAAVHNKTDEDKTSEQKSTLSSSNDVVSLYLVAQKGNDLKGEQILSAAYAVHLEYGEMNIFHRKDAQGKTIFSLVNMMEPGTFDIDRMHEMSTRGISLFTQLSLCDNPVQALDDMLICAHSLASMLSIQLCDQHRQLLNKVFTKALREKAKGFAADKDSSC